MSDRKGAAAANIGRRTATVEYNRQDPANCGRREYQQKKVHGMAKFDAELGYKAMIRFLEKYFETTGSDDVGALLGNMSTTVFSDGRPADPAMWEEWLESVQEVNASS